MISDENSSQGIAVSKPKIIGIALVTEEDEHLRQGAGDRGGGRDGGRGPGGMGGGGKEEGRDGATAARPATAIIGI